MVNKNQNHWIIIYTFSLIIVTGKRVIHSEITKKKLDEVKKALDFNTTVDLDTNSHSEKQAGGPTLQ